MIGTLVWRSALTVLACLRAVWPQRCVRLACACAPCQPCVVCLAGWCGAAARADGAGVPACGVATEVRAPCLCVRALPAMRCVLGRLVWRSSACTQHQRACVRCGVVAWWRGVERALPFPCGRGARQPRARAGHVAVLALRARAPCTKRCVLVGAAAQGDGDHLTPPSPWIFFFVLLMEVLQERKGIRKTWQQLCSTDAARTRRAHPCRFTVNYVEAQLQNARLGYNEVRACWRVCACVRVLSCVCMCACGCASLQWRLPPALVPRARPPRQPLQSRSPGRSAWLAPTTPGVKMRRSWPDQPI